MTTSSDPSTIQCCLPGRLLAWLGFVAALLGLAGYIVQILVFKSLFEPWYLPIVGSLGAGLVVLALLRARSLWRIVGVAFCALLAGFEWWFLIWFTKLPPYTGPVEVKKPFPSFTTTLADEGKSFNRARFMGDKNTVLVFFRGRW
jgi:hypothetical protein